MQDPEFPYPTGLLKKFVSCSKITPMKMIFLFCLALWFLSCNSQGEKTGSSSPDVLAKGERTDIANVLDEWHKAAANAEFDEYFDRMSDDGIFIGTDPTENWQNQEFKEWSKPYFDRGNAWDFTALERNIYFSSERNIAWFDELLDTQMGICRGSGILSKKDESWKIEHYVLSIAIPNENVSEMTELKKEFDSRLISQLKSK